MGAYIAVDWGTTNRRAYLIDAGGAVLDTVRDDRGVLAIERSDYPREVAALRERLGALPVIAAGMIGSTRGWVDAPYVPAPVDLGTFPVELGWHVRYRGDPAHRWVHGEIRPIQFSCSRRRNSSGCDCGSDFRGFSLLLPPNYRLYVHEREHA